MINDNATNNNPRLDNALAYALRGWRVLPLHSPTADGCSCGKPDCGSCGKHPRTRSGVKDATTDEVTIRQWWSSNPDANVGIATGPESGIFMLGPDGQQGLDDLRTLEEANEPLPTTTRQSSGGGGAHYLFKWPVVGGVKTCANLNGLHIDIRGDGGYFVAAPSQHKSGKPYVMTISPEAAPPAEAPAWLLDVIRKGKGSAQPKTNGTVLKVRASVDDATSRAIAYLAQCPPAISGQLGHNQTMSVARAIIYGFNLGVDAGFDLLKEHYNPRCQPPWSDYDLLHKCKEADEDETCKKPRGYLLGDEDDHTQGGAARVTDEDVESFSLPEPPQHPVLDHAALHGLAGHIVQTIEPHTESDPVAVLMHVLVNYGNLIGRNAHYIVDGAAHYGNLFACLVGASSHGRKGTAGKRVERLFQAVDPDWSRKCHAPGGLNSGEGVIHAVRDSVEKKVRKGNNGSVVAYQKVIQDEGILDKRLLVVESEFAQPLKVMKRDGNTLSPIVRQAWDDGNLRTLTKNSPETATAAHISIIGNITQIELKQAMNQTEVFNGFANRFLWILVKRSKFLPDGGGELDLSMFEEQLKDAVRFGQQKITLERTGEAAKLWEEVYPDLTSDRCGLYGAVTARAEAQVLRLSMLFALLDQSPRIDVPHIEAALALWRYCDESARIIFGGAEDPLQAKLFEALRASPNGLTRTDLHNYFHKHVKKETLAQALAALRGRNKVYPLIQPTAGRSVERWFAGKPTKVTNQTEGSASRTDSTNQVTGSERGELVLALPYIPFTNVI